MKRSTKAAQAKSREPKKPSREHSSKTVGRQKAQKPARIQGARSRATPEPSPAAAAPRQSKQAAVIALLRRPEGVKRPRTVCGCHPVVATISATVTER